MYSSLIEHQPTDTDHPATAAAHHVFLMAEGFAPTVIDSQVLDTLRSLQAHAIQSDLVAMVTFGALRTNWDSYLTRRARYRTILGTRVLLLPAWQLYRAGSATVLAFLTWAVTSFNPTTRLVIHARGHHAAHVAIRLKRIRPNVKVLYDIRGDAASEYRMMAKQFGDLGAKRQLAYIDEIVTSCVREADAFVVVSAPLRDVMTHTYGLNPQVTSIIACLADERRFFYSPEQREQLRTRWGLQDKHVLIFAGSTGRWHHVEHTLKWARRIMERDDAAFFVGLTPDVSQLTAVCGQILPPHRYLVHTAEHDEVPGWLNAADLGMLLRKADPVNSVASPTKFAEYMLCGLPTLTSVGLGDVTHYVTQNRAGVVESGEIIDDLVSECLDWLHGTPDPLREARARIAVFTYSKAAGIPRLADIYRRLAQI
ncbi:MAG: hypothetical protein HUU55_02880 [Myxococcales bacterium]|nr:hypothetical protein [Myxococcales bacterium]